MKLLRIGLLMLLSASQVSALTIENKTSTELIVSIQMMNSAISRKVAPKSTKDFSIQAASAYMPFPVTVQAGEGGASVTAQFHKNDHITVTGNAYGINVG